MHHSCRTISSLRSPAKSHIAKKEGGAQLIETRLRHNQMFLNFSNEMNKIGEPVLLINCGGYVINANQEFLDFLNTSSRQLTGSIFPPFYPALLNGRASQLPPLAKEYSG